MRIGVPREIKDKESRVGLTPRGAAALRARGREVLIERGAGLGCGFADAEYEAVGAVLADAAGAWGCCAARPCSPISTSRARRAR